MTRLTAISNIGMATAFAAGVVSFLSPCVLPLVPGYVSYVSGNALGGIERSASSRLSTLFLSGCFVLGFGIVTFASFTCQPRGALEDRMEENQRFREVAIVANPLENRLFLASVTMLLSELFLPNAPHWPDDWPCRPTFA
jgi:Cytochrome C biogenesis protein transmembrane region